MLAINLLMISMNRKKVSAVIKIEWINAVPYAISVGACVLTLCQMFQSAIYCVYLWVGLCINTLLQYFVCVLEQNNRIWSVMMGAFSIVKQIARNVEWSFSNWIALQQIRLRHLTPCIYYTLCAWAMSISSIRIKLFAFIWCERSAFHQIVIWFLLVVVEFMSCSHYLFSYGHTFHIITFHSLTFDLPRDSDDTHHIYTYVCMHAYMSEGIGYQFRLLCSIGNGLGWLRMSISPWIVRLPNVEKFSIPTYNFQGQFSFLSQFPSAK